MTIKFFVYFQFLLYFTTGAVDGVHESNSERFLKWDGGGGGEEG